MFKKTTSILTLTVTAFLFLAFVAQKNSASNAEDFSTAATESRSKNSNNLELFSTESAFQKKTENRCGWYENPTPGNHWLTDKDGTWIIGAQGGFQADGDYPPAFSDAQWVKTNINYGYGCACLRVQTDKQEKRILKVVSATARPLSACRKDKALKEPVE